jgi:hypothetical protein
MPTSRNQVLALRRNSPNDDWRFAGFWIRANVPDGFFEEHPQGEYVIVPMEELNKFKITAPSDRPALSLSEALEEAEPTMDLG